MIETVSRLLAACVCILLCASCSRSNSAGSSVEASASPERSAPETAQGPDDAAPSPAPARTLVRSWKAEGCPPFHLTLHGTRVSESDGFVAGWSFMPFDNRSSMKASIGRAPDGTPALIITAITNVAAMGKLRETDAFQRLPAKPGRYFVSARLRASHTNSSPSIVLNVNDGSGAFVKATKRPRSDERFALFGGKSPSANLYLKQISDSDWVNVSCEVDYRGDESGEVAVHVLANRNPRLREEVSLMISEVTLEWAPLDAADNVSKSTVAMSGASDP